MTFLSHLFLNCVAKNCSVVINRSTPEVEIAMLKKVMPVLLTGLLCHPVGAEHHSFSNTENASIPDDPKALTYSLIDTMALPLDASIESVAIKFRIAGDDTCVSDYKVSLVYLPNGEAKSKKFAKVFDGKQLEGKCTDEGFDLDEDNDNDLVMEFNDSKSFNQLPPRGKWYLAVRDQKQGNSGEIAYFKLSIDYQQPEAIASN